MEIERENRERRKTTRDVCGSCEKTGREKEEKKDSTSHKNWVKYYLNLIWYEIIYYPLCKKDLLRFFIERDENIIKLFDKTLINVLYEKRERKIRLFFRFRIGKKRSKSVKEKTER